MDLFEAIMYEIEIFYTSWDASNNWLPLFLEILSLIKRASSEREVLVSLNPNPMLTVVSHLKFNSMFIHLVHKYILMSQYVADCVHRKWGQGEEWGTIPTFRELQIPGKTGVK